MGAILLAGCEAGPTQSQPLDSADRAKLEHERLVVSDRYAEVVRRQTELEARSLDARLRSAEQKIASLKKDLAKVDDTLATLDRQRKELLAQMELGGVIAASQPGGAKRDWADQVAGLVAMRSQAELDRVGVQARLASAEDEMASVRQAVAQRDILAREALVLEKRLIELNRALKGKP
jgi:chromosome segregation ATPase